MTADRDSSAAADSDGVPSSDTGPAPGSRGSTLAVIRAISTAQRRQQDHRQTATRRKKALAYVMLAALLPFVGAIAWSGYRLGQLVADGGLDGLLTLARWYVPVMIGLYAFMGANEVDTPLLEFEARELLLTSVRDRDLVLGLLLADFRTQCWTMLGWTLLLTVAFGVGAGSVTVAVVATVAGSVLAVASLLLGYVIGLAGTLAMARLSVSETVRAAMSGLGMIAIFLVFAAGGMLVGRVGAEGLDADAVAALDPEGPPPIPIGYYADFFVVGTPLSAGIGPLAVASAAVVAGTIPLCLRAIVALAPACWRLDPVRTESDADSEALEAESPPAPSERRDWPWLEVPSGYVADGIVRRSIRLPGRLSHLTYYGMVASSVVLVGLLESVALTAAVGGALAALGVLLAGGAVGLNPLGEEGAMLDQLVLADYPPETFVRARVLAGVVLGLPLVVVGTALLGLEFLSATETVLVGGALVALVPASAAVAVGIGTLLPQSEPGRVLQTFDGHPPEKLAMLAHGVLVAVLAGGAVWLLTTDLEPMVRWGGLAILAATTVIAADGSYRFAVRGFADYGRPKTPDPIYALELATGVGLLGLVLSLTLEAGIAPFLGLTGPATFTVAFVASYVGWALAGVAYLVSSGRSWAYLDTRVPAGRDARYLAVGIAGSIAVYGAFVGVVTALEAPVVGHALATEIADGGLLFLVLLIALVVLVNAPVEEFLFRNVLQKRLSETISERSAILATAALFAVLHVPAYFSTDPVAVAVTLAPLAALAVLWGWLYARTGTVVVPALCHGVYNAAVFGTAYVWLL